MHTEPTSIVVPIYILAGQSNAARTGLDSALINALGEQLDAFELVKVAEGSTYLAKRDHFRADWNIESEGEWFDRLIIAVQERVAHIRAQGLVPEIKGLFWIQGEADSIYSGPASQYQKNLADFINQLRVELETDVPVIISGLSSSKGKETEKIKQAQQSVAAEIPKVTLLDTSDLTFLPDAVHYDALAQVKLARKLVDRADLNVDRSPTDEFTYTSLTARQTFVGTEDADRMLFKYDYRDLVLNGGAGDDRLHAGRGDNILDGGAGNDTLLSSLGNDTLNGGDGNDTINAAYRYYEVLLPYDPLNPWSGFDNDVIDGGLGDDSITDLIGNNTVFGGLGADTILLGYGRDSVYGGDDNDYIKTGIGDDTVFADKGHDFIRGEDGHDNLNGGDGNDTIHGGEGHDIVSAGNGNDLVYGGNGNDLISGSDGNDVVYGEAGDDNLKGKNGNDWITAGDGNDRIEGDAGHDVLRGDGGDDRIYGGDGHDKLYGGLGHDIVDAGAGDDRIIDSIGHDRLYGGLGADQFIFDITWLSNEETANPSHYSHPQLIGAPILPWAYFGDLFLFGDNVIVDFQPGTDTIVLGGGFGFLDLLGQFSDTSLGAVLQIGYGSYGFSIAFRGLTAAMLQLHPESFLFPDSAGSGDLI